MPISQLDLEAILWDMDGTLVDTEPLWVECETQLMLEFNYVWSHEDSHYCIGGPMEKVERYMREKSGSGLDASWFGDRLVEMMLERLKTGVTLQPGVASIMDQAQKAGIRQAIVSASRRQVVDAVIEGINFPFDHSVSASEVVLSKPHPESYLSAASSLGIGMKSCVIFEDSMTGIRSGLESGGLTFGLSPVELEHSNFVKLGDLVGITLDDLLTMHRSWIAGRQIVEVIR